MSVHGCSLVMAPPVRGRGWRLMWRCEHRAPGGYPPPARSPIHPLSAPLTRWPAGGQSSAVGICMLGPPLVDGDGALAPRDRMVLGVLAVRRGQVVTPDQVADAVWGERPPSSWPTQVQICVGRLRKVLGATAIETIGGGYRLTLSGDEVDVDRFEQLVEHGRGLAATGEPDRAAAAFTRALGLWRGRPFEDLDGWEPGRSEAARLEELRRSAEEELLDARLAAGEHRAGGCCGGGVGRRGAAARATLGDPGAGPVPLWPPGRRLAIAGPGAATAGRPARASTPGPSSWRWRRRSCARTTALAAPEPPAAVSGECPYKGLAAYDVGDADVFFGRDHEVAACLERLRSTPLLVVAGPSGCGKSSLVARRAGPCTGAPWPVGGGDRARRRPRRGDVRGAERRRGNPGGGGRPVRGAVHRSPSTPTSPAAFCRRITRYAHGTGAGRDLCARRPPRRAVDRHRLRPARRTGSSPRQPASRRTGCGRRSNNRRSRPGYRLEPGLVDLLVRDSEGEPGALPLLSHALVETWRRRDGHVLTVEGYRASGGIRGAVARSADRLLRQPARRTAGDAARHPAAPRHPVGRR